MKNELRAFAVEEAAEEELLRLFFTHPAKMDGAGKLKQHDNVHKQITTFEKLLQHAMSRFSKEKLYQMLRILQRGIPELPKVPYHRDRASDNMNMDYSIRSLENLRMIVSNFKNERRRGIQKEEETHLINYFDSVFDDLRYLKDLKKHFDEKIYCCLYDYYYDPLDDINGAFDVDLSREKALIVLEDEKDSGHSSMPGSDEDPQTSRRVKFNAPEDKPGVKLDHMNDKEKLSYAVREMYSLNQNWDKVFSEGELDFEWFEVDSHYELLEFSRYENFELILRLIPDIFVKAFKSAELAKLWWTQANKVYPHVPNSGSRISAKEFDARVDVLERNIKELGFNISQDEHMLQIANEESKKLKHRENRYNVLSSRCEEVEELLNETNGKYKALYDKRELIKKDLEYLLPGSEKYKNLEEKLANYDQRLIKTSGKLKLIKYHFDLLRGDFDLELEVRPNIIRFFADAKARVKELEESVFIKKQIKRQAEKQLVLLRTNCDRMNKIMRKKLGSSSEEQHKQRIEKKRNRRRPNSQERRIARERLQREQQDKHNTLPEDLQPRRDATFVTSVASDQDSNYEKEPRSRYFDSLEVERITIPPHEVERITIPPHEVERITIPPISPHEEKESPERGRSHHRGHERRYRRKDRDSRDRQSQDRGSRQRGSRERDARHRGSRDRAGSDKRRTRRKTRSVSLTRGSETDSQRVIPEYESDLTYTSSRPDSWVNPPYKLTSRRRSRDCGRNHRSPSIDKSPQRDRYENKSPIPEQRDDGKKKRER